MGWQALVEGEDEELAEMTAFGTSIPDAAKKIEEKMIAAGFNVPIVSKRDTVSPSQRKSRIPKRAQSDIEEDLTTDEVLPEDERTD